MIYMIRSACFLTAVLHVHEVTAAVQDCEEDPRTLKQRFRDSTVALGRTRGGREASFTNPIVPRMRRLPAWPNTYTGDCPYGRAGTTKRASWQTLQNCFDLVDETSGDRYKMIRITDGEWYSPNSEFRCCVWFVDDDVRKEYRIEIQERDFINKNEDNKRWLEKFDRDWTIVPYTEQYHDVLKNVDDFKNVVLGALGSFFLWWTVDDERLDAHIYKQRLENAKNSAKGVWMDIIGNQQAPNLTPESCYTSNIRGVAESAYESTLSKLSRLKEFPGTHCHRFKTWDPTGQVKRERKWRVRRKFWHARHNDKHYSPKEAHYYPFLPEKDYPAGRSSVFYDYLPYSTIDEC